MWENICFENQENILKVLEVFKSIINGFENEILDGKKIYNFFYNSKKYRDSFANKKINGNIMPEIDIMIKDENGALAKVTKILSENNIGIKNLEVMNNRENNFGVLKVIVDSYKNRDNAYVIIKKNGYDVKKID